MKLPSRSHLVKPDLTVLAVAGVTALVTVLGVYLVLTASSREQAHMDRVGNAAAGILAELAVEPVMRRDRLHLGVIGNRLAETPAIRGVTTYSSNNDVLTSTGIMEGPQYTAPVVIDDSIVGYVRVAVHPPAFAPDGTTQLLALLAVALLVPMLVAVGWSLAGAARRGELRPTMPSRPSWLKTAHADDAGPAGEPIIEHAPDPVDVPHYLLAVNFYNQLTLPGSEREFERALCRELAEAVAEIYQGRVVSLPGVGALLDFDHTADEDRPFQVLCAAFVMIRLLRDEAPFGHYRLGLNLTERTAGETPPFDDAAVADAALLSALAKDEALAVSAPFAEALQGEKRCFFRPLVNPLLDQLTTSGPGCRLITGLEPTSAALVARQVEQLKAQRDATSSPSTF